MDRRMCKDMIEYLKENPLLKKVFNIMIITILSISVITCFVNYYITEQVYKQNINSTLQLVGTLTRLNPENETEIVKTVLFKKYDAKNLEYGKSIAKKYGYGDEVTAWNDDAFNKNVYNMIKINFILFIVILIESMLIFRSCSLYVMKRLEYILNSVDEAVNGKLLTDMNSFNEGILSKIYSKMCDLSRILNLNIEKLYREKENIKYLVTDISHQIKTPISSIKLFNSILIEDESISKNEKREFLNTIKEEVLKLEWLTGSLIKLSRLEAGMIELKKEKRSIKYTIHKAIEGVYSKVLQKNIEINVENVYEFSIFHDVRWTKEAIVNVLENAIKYTDSNGKINVSMTDMNFFIRIDIEDTGIGIPGEDFNKIFKQFFRGNCKIVQESEGSGIGLYLTRKILEEQGGSIMVDSKLGEGSKFSLFLQKCK
ncbi:sensor histidine kinase [Clostridium ljungdahlii]|uniref:sensor histidine kinase n=1 Tax=Clostridium ljungdahlii TaxID=1538 RepID=UPI003866E7D0